jgi:homoserine kinase type II
MAVFTSVPRHEAASFVQRFGLGELTDLQPCAGGIENTNYFLDTTGSPGANGHPKPPGRYVLTLFERLTHDQLPFYLRLMQHLAQRGIPVPAPQADAHGEVLFTLLDKPAALVERLAGRSELAPAAEHCALLGQVQARMHLAGADFPMHQPNLRGLGWWVDTAPVVAPFLSAPQAQLLQTALAEQVALASSAAYAKLPRGPAHCDLFRDNVMFHVDETGRLTLTGVFDFYFAGVDTWVFDLAVALNDWTIDLATGQSDPVRHATLLNAYEAVRPLSADERQLLPAMLRAGALRFWISRLWDYHLPRSAHTLTPHDPRHFERVLTARWA